MKTIFKKKNKKSNYTKIDNKYIKRKDLTLKAKGLLTYLLSLPEDWDLNFNELLKHHVDGHDSTRAALDELKEKGYIKYKKTRNNKGHFKHNYTIYEEPYKDNP